MRPNLASACSISGLDVGFLGDVGAHEARGRTELLRQALALRLPPPGDDHLGALFDEQLGRARADAAGSAGDDCDLAVQCTHSLPLLVLGEARMSHSQGGGRQRSCPWRAECPPCPITSNSSTNPAGDASIETGLAGRTGGTSPNSGFPAGDRRSDGVAGDRPDVAGVVGNDSERSDDRDVGRAGGPRARSAQAQTRKAQVGNLDDLHVDVTGFGPAALATPASRAGGRVVGTPHCSLLVVTTSGVRPRVEERGHRGHRKTSRTSRSIEVKGAVRGRERTYGDNPWLKIGS